MDGFGVHTFSLINKGGKVTFVKFHWLTSQGVKCLTREEAVVVGGSNHSHATKDLIDSIEAAKYPEWKLHIQTMEPGDQDKLEFDPLDATKIWPEDRFPLQPVGRLVLNKNVDNFFAENEQLAFSPSLVVPGIYYSDDRMLQARIFAYPDTQRHRLGPNYLQLPVNAPKCAYRNNHHDGFMNCMYRDEEVNYFQSRFDPVRHSEKVPMPSNVVTGQREKVSQQEKVDNFGQAGDRFRSWAPDRQERFIKIWASHLADPKVTPEIRQVWLGYWSQCSKEMGEKLAKFLQATAS